ncbi:MAG: tRNA-dihydrouridine synthase family protein [Acidobacteria bacterium]|nr:MAG: tRNA-dihydrouridine synthase family protein [Acidobacteriota bacterium]
MSFLSDVPGALVMGPMTKGSNLPYRRLAVEMGARITVSEMTLARRLKQRRRGEYALIRRAPDEPCFGVQLAGTDPEEMAWAAALVEERGADFVDVNLSCPIDFFTSKGIGAATARQPRRVRRIVEAMKGALRDIPVTVKIRLGWDDMHRNHVEVAQAAVDGGASAVFVHGRTRNARYRAAADWNAIGEVVAAVNVPVVWNGDLLFPHEVGAARLRSGSMAVMTARGALIKPWFFSEMATGYRDVSAEERVSIYRRYVSLALEHWGEDGHGMTRAREFLRWHLGFWCRYVPRRPDGTWPAMQQRESSAFVRTPMEALLARADEAALEWLADRLIARDEIDLAAAPPPAGTLVEVDSETQG